ncbi:MAG: hypothetical protein ACREPI_06965 [Candidatus Dormibacterales bacterium]
MTDGRDPQGPEREMADMERRLESLFAALAPRPGFDAELRERLRPKGPRARWRAWLASLGTARLAPILAAVLVVGLAGLAFAHGLGQGSGSPSGSSALKSGAAPSQEGPGGGAAETPALPGAFGPLPQSLAGLALKAAEPPRPGGSLPAEKPGPGIVVYRYAEPTAEVAARFAASLGASPAGPPPAGALGLFKGPGFTLTVYGSDAARGLPPRFLLQGTPRTVYHPALPNTMPGPLVDPFGRPVASAFPLQLAAADYARRPAPLAPGGGGKVEVAYTAVPDGPVGYLEPVYVVSSASGAVLGLEPAVAGPFLANGG